jgi:hypothetical protein
MRTRKRPPGGQQKAPAGLIDLAAVFVLLACVSAAALWWNTENGYLLYYGDAQAHLAIARRIVDSRTPGLDQVGTVWLPLPHLLMLPFVVNEKLWRSGLAGSLPSSASFVLAGAFLYAAVRRQFQSLLAAVSAVLLFALNPNLLYLQSIPMTEAIFFAALAVLLFASIWFRQDGSSGAVMLAAAAVIAASLTRYEGWFLIPFATLYFWLAHPARRIGGALVFAVGTGAVPLAWLAHNWWHYGNVLEFYNGPYSAKAIYQRALDGGMALYPGDRDWSGAWVQLQAAVRLCAGAGLTAAGVTGVAAAVCKRAFWPLALLSLPPAFYLLSIYSSGTPIFVPHLWPNSYYNTRYGMAAFLLLVFAGASLVAAAPGRIQPLAALFVVAGSVAPWLAYPRPSSWICWKESEVNSTARREWTSQAAIYLRQHYRQGDGIYSSFGDLAGIFREAGIPLREVLHEGNHPHWNAATARPDLFLWEEWAVAIAGDTVSTVLQRAGRNGPRYDCVKMITVKGAPVIEIYRRASRFKDP